MATTEHNLSPPTLDELAQVLAPALKTNYSQSSVIVEECPDLRQPPFCLAGQGLSGDEVVADIGGQPNLFPRPLLDKKYSMIDCAKGMNMSADGGFLLGAGAGPFHIVGQNSELAPNFSWNNGFDNIHSLTQCLKIIDSTGSDKGKLISQDCADPECGLMMNLFGSRGQPGPVLKVTAHARKGEGKSFSEFIRTTINKAYGDDRQITLGGVFLLKKGKAVFHVMPDFPPESALPFKDRDAVNNWLTFHQFEAPVVCLSILHSADPEKLDLRMEHTHCFSAEGKNEGGHYHCDLVAGDDAEEVTYEGYFNTANILYRMDKPSS